MCKILFVMTFTFFLQSVSTTFGNDTTLKGSLISYKIVVISNAICCIKYRQSYLIDIMLYSYSQTICTWTTDLPYSPI